MKFNNLAMHYLHIPKQRANQRKFRLYHHSYYIISTITKSTKVLETNVTHLKQGPSAVCFSNSEMM